MYSSLQNRLNSVTIVDFIGSSSKITFVCLALQTTGSPVMLKLLIVHLPGWWIIVVFRGLVSQKFTAPDESLTNMLEPTSGVVWAFSILNGESSLSHSDIEHLYLAGLKPDRLIIYYLKMNMNTQCILIFLIMHCCLASNLPVYT